MNTVIVGLIFGDEAKGKVTDYYAEDADVVVRFSGGANSGHSIYHNGAKVVLRLIPSGIFHNKVKCVLAQGMVIDPIVLYKEILNLKHKNIDLENRLYISNRAHVVTAKHIDDDSNNTTSLKVGTTKKGIGPAYADKAMRNGIRINDLMNIDSSLDLMWLKSIAGGQEQAEELKQAIETIKPFVTDTSYLINTMISSGHEVLFEGAQGTMLDIDHGTYPYVTSSNSIAGGACTGSGVGPNKIHQVIGVAKTYVTRVGEGPFPTEIKGEVADQLRKAGNEYGSVTKRPRRVGWFDVPCMKYAAMINGLDTFVLAKLDVLSCLDKVKVCVSYSGLDIIPTDLGKVALPDYVELDGWSDSKDWISKVNKYEDLPGNARAYVEYLESKVGVSIGLISVGPERNQVINRSEHVRQVTAQNSMKEFVDAIKKLESIAEK